MTLSRQQRRAKARAANRPARQQLKKATKRLLEARKRPGRPIPGPRRYERWLRAWLRIYRQGR